MSRAHVLFLLMSIAGLVALGRQQGLWNEFPAPAIKYKIAIFFDASYLLHLGILLVLCALQKVMCFTIMQIDCPSYSHPRRVVLFYGCQIVYLANLQL